MDGCRGQERARAREREGGGRLRDQRRAFALRAARRRPISSGAHARADSPSTLVPTAPRDCVPPPLSSGILSPSIFLDFAEAGLLLVDVHTLCCQSVTYAYARTAAAARAHTLIARASLLLSAPLLPLLSHALETALFHETPHWMTRPIDNREQGERVSRRTSVLRMYGVLRQERTGSGSFGSQGTPSSWHIHDAAIDCPSHRKLCYSWLYQSRGTSANESYRQNPELLRGARSLTVAKTPLTDRVAAKSPYPLFQGSKAQSFLLLSPHSCFANHCKLSSQLSNTSSARENGESSGDWSMRCTVSFPGQKLAGSRLPLQPTRWYSGRQRFTALGLTTNENAKH